VAYCYRRNRVVSLSAARPLCHDREPCENCWTDRDAFSAMDLNGSKELRIRWGCTLAPHSEYYWTVRGHMSNYFDHLSSLGCYSLNAVRVADVIYTQTRREGGGLAQIENIGLVPGHWPFWGVLSLIRFNLSTKFALLFVAPFRGNHHIRNLPSLDYVAPFVAW